MSSKFLPFAFSLLPFLLLCTLNSATYRYGASDQAFYVPAVLLRLHPDFFPRDASLIASQARLTMMDEVVSGLARLSGAPLPVLLLALYAVSLLLLATAAWLIASRVYRVTWTAIALLAALTLRHAIWRTGTNTLEGYFHPRQLAFGIAALGVAAMLRGRPLPAAAATAAAALVHPTTALWFAIWIGVATAVAERRFRVPLAAGAVLAGLTGLWALTAGPLAGRLLRMDPEWVATLATKDYLFPFEWPATVWIVNLLCVPVIAVVYWRRRAAGLADRFEQGMVWGGLSLLAVFGLALPLNAAHVALAVQLQPSRIFWMLDFIGMIYLVWALAEGTSPTARRAQLTAAAVVVLSLVRGAYVGLVRFPDRRVVQLDIRADDWGHVMAWARTTDPGSGWLADPMHAVWYGTSVRVAGERDVLVEAVKDAAIGMYDRAVAIRTRDRIAAAGDFSALSTERARALGLAYGLDYLVAEKSFDLPLAFESGQLRIYRLR